MLLFCFVFLFLKQAKISQRELDPIFTELIYKLLFHLVKIALA